MGYPTGPLLRVLAKRVLANLKFMDDRAPKWDSPERDREPFTDTQLLISTLGFLVFPHERAPDALGQLLKEYGKNSKLSDVITVRYPVGDAQPIEIAGEDGSTFVVDPEKIEGLPRLLRNSIAHFNVRPISTDDGRFGGVRVWNRGRSGDITFVADLDFDQLRKLAEFMLTSFSSETHDKKGFEDPEDPMKLLEKKQRKSSRDS